MKTYRHTQSGRYIVLGVGSIFLIIAVAGLAIHSAIIKGAFVMLPVVWLFHSLTIEITESELRWWFGPGLISKRVALTDIASAQVVRTSVLEGWGIHYSRFGWLYNVSGFEAVAVTLKNGRTFCLGTDEPAALQAALAECGEAVGSRR